MNSDIRMPLAPLQSLAGEIKDRDNNGILSVGDELVNLESGGVHQVKPEDVQRPDVFLHNLTGGRVKIVTDANAVVTHLLYSDIDYGVGQQQLLGVIDFKSGKKVTHYSEGFVR